MYIQPVKLNNIPSQGLKPKKKDIQPFIDKASNLDNVTTKTSFWMCLKNKIKKNINIQQLPPKSKLNPDKVQSDKIFELESIIKNKILTEEFFKAYPDIDINSQDSEGNTLLLRAIKRNDEDMLRALRDIDKLGKYGKVDWNVVDSKGNNAFMIDIIELEPDDFNYLSNILSDYTNANYINPKTKLTALQLAIKNNNSYYIHLLSRISDVNKTHPDTPPASFMIIAANDIGSYTKDDFPWYKTDLDATYKGKTIFEYVNVKKVANLSSNLLHFLEKHLSLKNLKKMREYYKQEGMLDINQLLDYIKQPCFSEICNESINEIGENIGHFITEIYPENFEEIKLMSEIIDRIDNCHYNFESKDSLGRTAIDKAIEGQNLIVLRFLLAKIPPIRFYLTKFLPEFYKNIEKKLAEFNISDPKVLEIFKGKTI